MRAALLCCLLGLVACGRDGGRAGGSTVTDSAGVRVVTSTIPEWGDGSGWRVDSVPLLSIGESNGPNPILLVEVNGVRLLSDGRVAVVSGGENAVLYFDATGKLLRKSGRSGAGPGEFRSVALVGALGDSLLIWDGQLDRATLLDPEGKVARTFTLTRADTVAGRRFGFAPAATFTSGGLLVAGRAGAATGDRSGIRRDTIPLRTATAAGVLGGEVVRVPGTEAVVVTTPKYVTRFDRPFGRRTSIATRGTETVVSTGDLDGVALYDTSGRETASYRIDRARRAIPASDIDALGRKQGEQITQLPPDLASPLRKVILDAGVPATLPTAYQVLVDAAGAIWLRDDVGPVLRDSIPQHWSVLSPAGAWLGGLTTPRRMDVHQVTGDRVIGVWHDENDVEYVRIYRLRR
ncbi:MAG: hypothetical protein V4503_11930 [Gemmatimonadota bacterium]